MSERPEDLRDDLLGARLKSAFDAPPSRLSSRLDRLAAAGLRAPARPGGVKPEWLVAAPQWVGSGLALAFVVTAVPRLWTLIAGAAPATAPPAFLASGALSALMLPLGVLLGVEAMRGAPTVRRWLG